ncbi:MAG: hypothetical protein RLZZ618_164 [Pseudomonadota bacterium]
MRSSTNRLLRLLQARTRLIIAVLLAVAVGMALPTDLVGHNVTRLLIAWNTGTVFYVVMAAWMMAHSTPHHMCERAPLQDDGKMVILVLVIASAAASLAAIGGELSLVKTMQGPERAAHLGLTGMTVLSSWAFIQVMFTLHYAHDHYLAVGRGQPAPLQFPGGRP